MEYKTTIILIKDNIFILEFQQFWIYKAKNRIHVEGGRG